MAAAFLIFMDGPNAGRRHGLGRGEHIVGRRSDCEIFIPDMRVSRRHARIYHAGSQWMIEDLGSSNGTYVNGERVHAARLAHDDELLIAGHRVRVELPRPGKSDPDAHLTAVDMPAPRVYVSARDGRELAPASRRPPASRRLLERKLHGLQAILELAANITDADELVASVVVQLLDVFPQAHAVGVLVEDERSRELRVRHHRTRGAEPGQGELDVPAAIIEHVARDHRGVLLGDPGAEPGPVREPTGSHMGAPLQARNVHYGIIYVRSADQAFRQDDLDLLTSIAAQAGLAMHTARMHAQLLERQRLERDLRVAQQIQRSLMRDPPRVAGLSFAVHYAPAHHIGGDFYDFLWHDADHLGLVIGDVAGKAISAALYMARLTSELRGRAGIACSPGRLLERINGEMTRLGDDGMFATMVYAVYQLSTGILAFTNAGHCVPLLRRGDRVLPLHADRAHTPPIGILADLAMGEAQVQLHPGDVLVLVSDGIIEARDSRGHEYGLERLSRCVGAACGEPADVVQAILADVDGFVTTGVVGDDTTIVVMQVGQLGARRRSITAQDPPGAGDPPA